MREKHSIIGKIMGLVSFLSHAKGHVQVFCSEINVIVPGVYLFTKGTYL